uniref:NPAS4 bHLH domain-containing protein n=1 Tax=Anopheles farauti TaxID=69004 RepID=A0A182QNJ7_9DIPT
MKGGAVSMDAVRCNACNAGTPPIGTLPGRWTCLSQRGNVPTLVIGSAPASTPDPGMHNRAQAKEAMEMIAVPTTSRAQEMVTMRFDANKSTKGASKLRRDLINSEIANLRDLLPLPQSTRQRLSQLQLMALVCVFRLRDGSGATVSIIHSPPKPLKAIPAGFAGGRRIILSVGLLDSDSPTGGICNQAEAKR